MTVPKLLFAAPFRSLPAKWKAARIALVVAIVILAALIFDLALLSFLEKVVNRAGDVKHIYETQIVIK